MLANIIGHEGLLTEGRVLDCEDPRVDDWLARGLAEVVAPPAEMPAAVAADVAPSPTVEIEAFASVAPVESEPPAAPARVEPPQAPRRRRH
jgi:hypothetical protein